MGGGGERSLFPAETGEWADDVNANHHTKFNVLTLSTQEAELIKLRLADVTTFETGYSPQRPKPGMKRRDRCLQGYQNFSIFAMLGGQDVCRRGQETDHLACVIGNPWIKVTEIGSWSKPKHAELPEWAGLSPDRG